MAGPEMDLDPKQALALALAVNELATNASKYGALSKPSGTVEVSWSRDGDRNEATFAFVWRERAVLPSSRRAGRDLGRE